LKKGFEGKEGRGGGRRRKVKREKKKVRGEKKAKVIEGTWGRIHWLIGHCSGALHLLAGTKKRTGEGGPWKSGKKIPSK